MKKIIILLFLLFSINSYAQDSFIDGQGINDVDILEFDGMSAPATAPLGKARIYMDSTSGTLQCSEDGGAYGNCVGGGGGGGGGSLNIEIDGSVVSSAATTLDFDSSDFKLTESPADVFNVQLNDSVSLLGSTIDISSETNLSAGTNLHLSGDTMHLDSSITLTGAVTASEFNVTGGSTDEIEFTTYGEKILQTTDDIIEMAGSSGTDNTDLFIDLDGTYPVIYSSIDSTVGFNDDLSVSGSVTINGFTIDHDGSTFTISDTLAFKNAETIDNDTDGKITISSFGGSNNETLTIDGESQTGPTITGSGDGIFFNSNIFIQQKYEVRDDVIQEYGNSADSGFIWETTGNDNLQLGLKTGNANQSGNFSIMDYNDLGNVNRSSSTVRSSPYVNIYGADEADADDVMELAFSSDDDAGIINVYSGKTLRFPFLKNCDTIDTDADGDLSCGTDSSGGAGGTTIDVQDSGSAIVSSSTISFNGNLVATNSGGDAQVTIADVYLLNNADDTTSGNITISNTSPSFILDDSDASDGGQFTFAFSDTGSNVQASLDPTTTGTENAVIRLFRTTSTSGSKSFLIKAGDGTDTTKVSINPNSTTYFDTGGNYGFGPDTTPDYFMDIQGELHVDGDLDLESGVKITTASSLLLSATTLGSTVQVVEAQISDLSHTADEVGTLTTGDLCINDGSFVNCTVNTEAELETALDSIDVVTVNTDDITSANLRTLISDESGTGAAIFSGGDIGAGTATTPSADDNDTSVATTAFVQGEINGAGGTNLTCSSGQCNVDDAFLLNTGDIIHGILVLDDTTLQIQEAGDTLSISVPTLTADRAVSFPDSSGEVSLLGQSIDLDGEAWGNLPVSNLDSGVNASSSTYWRGDGTWATVSVSETNSLETTITGILDTEIFVGNGANSGTFVSISGDGSLANTGALTVNDDSHNHVITNIDSFTETQLETQLSDVTALFTNNVTGDVTVSGGTSAIGTGVIVDADHSADTITHTSIADADQMDTKCFGYIESDGIDADDDFTSIWSNRTGNAFQVTEIWCETDTGTVTGMVQLDDGTVADCDSVDLVCASTAVEDTSLNSDCLVSADEQLDWATTSTASTPTIWKVCFTGNWVD